MRAADLPISISAGRLRDFAAGARGDGDGWTDAERGLAGVGFGVCFRVGVGWVFLGWMFFGWEL